MLFSFSTVLNQYIHIREHNLNVFKIWTECHSHNLNDESEKVCVELAKTQFVLRNVGSKLSGMYDFDKKLNDYHLEQEKKETNAN